MQQLTVQEGFFKHREHEAQSQAVLRSSAVFYALQSPQVSTELLLFNYWRYKRGIENLTLVMTLRNAAGSTVHRESEPLSFPGARTVTLAALLERAGRAAQAFEGSLEVEVLSPVNLHIPYPAVVVRYHGAGWHSTAHSYSRYLAETSGDSGERREALQQTCEGNWTVHPDQGVDTFFVIHNGAQAVAPHELRLTLTNHRGVRRDVLIPGIAYAQWETRRFFPGEHLSLREHLEGRPGCLEVSTQVSGVFPRMLCGHVRRADGAWSVDHSNFNYTGPAGMADCLPVQDIGSRKPLGFVVPTLAEPEWSCWADFYPTYPDRDYHGTLITRAADGSEVARRERTIGEGESPGIFRVAVSQLVATHDSVGAVDFTIAHPSRVPTRFHMGIHYRYRDGLPAFLIDGPMPYTATGIRSRWFPVLFDADTRTLLFIANQVFDRDQPQALEYEASVYNAAGDPPLTARFPLPAGATLATDLRQLIPGIEEFLGDAAGWVYLRADQPALSVVHYVMIKGNDSLAVDHAF